jgi:E3 ubiquitin-protein ligase UBR7
MCVFIPSHVPRPSRAYIPTRFHLANILQSIETCTKILGSLRQNVFACLTCNPPPTASGDWNPAGVCYACSVQCHGEHELVEIFQKRNFTCDCGTTRIPSTSPCTLRTNPATNTRGGVHSEEPDANNKYNQNFRNRFCGCECDYDPFQQKGTMFQCLGLGTKETGGCGEDWYHPGCLVGMGPLWFEKMKTPKKATNGRGHGTLAAIAESPIGTPVKGENGEQPAATQSAAQTNELAVRANESAVVDDEDDEPPMPPGFPSEDDFDGFICYKCVDANPWIKAYAGTPSFLPAVRLNHNQPTEETSDQTASKKRKAEDDAEETSDVKRVKSDDEAPKETAEQPADEANDEPASKPTTESAPAETRPAECKLPNLAETAPPLPNEPFSLFFKADFREKFCRCSSCYLKLDPHPQLLEEEEVYEPPLTDEASQHGGSTHGSGSLLERGESALRNVDRVRAIEGVMAYNHLKEKLKPFFQQFAESGEAVGAEDIKAYFAKLRGDEEGIKKAGEAAARGGGDDDSSNRQEQSGY